MTKAAAAIATTPTPLSTHTIRELSTVESLEISGLSSSEVVPALGDALACPALLLADPEGEGLGAA